MPNISVTMGAWNLSHPLDFTVSRPQGLSEWLFVCFRVPVELKIDGALVRGEAGDCILYEPGAPQWYRGRGVGLDNDWLHLDGPGMAEVARRYELPVNRLFRPRDVGFVPGLIQAVLHEQTAARPYADHAAALLVEELCLRLGRACHADSPMGLTPTEASHYELFQSIRAQVHQRLREPWDVPRMASLAHLSVPRFAVLYKRFYNISPVEDLIRVRLSYAQHLLTNTTMSVGEAAAQSGFDNVCHFSRLFRRRVGCAPRHYHRVAAGSWAEHGPS
ncbi:MAG: helix-turn-helix transcriptional regulator [Armatimonadetes bacterium]|nr:helix-turn-helix transcriptional regulator [Armatimonadota bacterium]